MPNAANSTESMVVRQMKLLGNMLGAEIDFVILGIDSKTRSVVASRREAMMRKRQLFYFSPDANGEYRVREGRVVQARVIAVADKSIRVEIFGVECSIMARDLAWDWIGDAHDRFAVGDQILVRVTEVNKTSQEELSVRADVKSVTENTSREALKRCRVQSKYAGRVTDSPLAGVCTAPVPRISRGRHRHCWCSNSGHTVPAYRPPRRSDCSARRFCLC